MCFSSNNGVRKCTFSTGRGQNRTCSRVAEARKPARQRTAIRSICISLLPCLRFAQQPRPGNKKLLFAKFRLRNAQINLAFRSAYSYLCPSKRKTPNGYGSSMRHRRIAQRRQIDPFQLPVERQGAGGQLPVLHHRTQRGRDHRARRTARTAGRDRQPQAGGADDHRDRGHRRTGQRRLQGRRSGQQVPGQHPQHARHHPRAALLRERQHHPCRRLGRPGARQGDHRHGTPAQGPGDRRSPAGQDPEAGGRRRRQERQTAGGAAAAIQGGAGAGAFGPHGRAGERGPQAGRRPQPADRQTGALRLQRRRKERRHGQRPHRSGAGAIAGEKAEMLVMPRRPKPTSPNWRATKNGRCSSKTSV